MNRLPVIGVLLLNAAVISRAQAQDPDMLKLKADAQKIVSIIRGDKTKTEAYCQVYGLGDGTSGRVTC
jgi:DNA-directed RNA polymerase subunit H (RpoH/RPB5)